MSPNRKLVESVVFGLRCLLILLSSYDIHGNATNNLCLRRIYDSLEDSTGYLDVSWNFDHYTEGALCGFHCIECWNTEESKVMNIKLSNMGLSGHFPLGIEHCTSLTGLDLSGPIPENLANCSYLNNVNLDHNRFSGQIPLELGTLSRIKSFSVANNNLSGPVPTFTSKDHTISKDSYANNPGLCGVPLDACPSQSKSHLFSVVGGAAEGLAFVIILIGVAFFYISKMKIIRMKLEDPEGNGWMESLKGSKASKLKYYYYGFMHSSAQK